MRSAERLGLRWAAAVSVALPVAAAALLVVLAPLVDDSRWDIRLLAVIPFLAGALAPRPAVALVAAAAAGVALLAGIWVRGPHTECDGSPEVPEAIGPAMTGCVDRPEADVVLFGLVAVAAWVLLAFGAAVGEWVRQWSRRA